MVLVVLPVDKSLDSMNTSLIAHLFKFGDREDIVNYRHITLLNVSYKIVAKLLQRQLEPLLSHAIDNEHYLCSQ